jgi:hypothetical protein
VRYALHRFSVSSAHLCLFLSNVVAVGEGENPRCFPGAFSHIRQLDSNCLVMRKETSGSLTEMTHDLGKRGGAITPKAGDARGNIPSRRGVFYQELAIQVGKR